MCIAIVSSDVCLFICVLIFYSSYFLNFFVTVILSLLYNNVFSLNIKIVAYNVIRNTWAIFICLFVYLSLLYDVLRMVAHNIVHLQTTIVHQWTSSNLLSV